MNTPPSFGGEYETGCKTVKHLWCMVRTPSIFQNCIELNSTNQVWKVIKCVWNSQKSPLCFHQVPHQSTANIGPNFASEIKNVSRNSLWCHVMYRNVFMNIKCILRMLACCKFLLCLCSLSKYFTEIRMYSLNLLIWYIYDNAAVQYKAEDIRVVHNS